MMRLPKFRYFSPTSVREAVRIRAGEGPDAAYVAGGTDLYPNMKRRQQTPKAVVGLSRIAELATLEERGGQLTLGAGALLSTVENDPRVRRDYAGRSRRSRLSLIHISEPTRQAENSYAVFC